MKQQLALYLILFTKKCLKHHQHWLMPLLMLILKKATKGNFKIMKIENIEKLEKRNTIKEAHDGYNFKYRTIDEPLVKLPKKMHPLGYNIVQNAQIHSESLFIFKNNIAYRQYFESELHPKFFVYKNYRVIDNTDKYLLLKNFGNHQQIEKGLFFGWFIVKNWYHWITEVLSKSALITHLPNHLQKYPIIVSKRVQKTPNHLELLRKVLPNNEIIYLGEQEMAYVKELVCLDSPTVNRMIFKGNFMQKALDNTTYWEFMEKYRLRLLEGVVISDKYPKRIFLARPDLGRRRYNQQEVIDLVKKYNFEILHMHEYDAMEQRNLFHNAKFIVGPLGAAFANLIFAQEGAHGIIFKPSDVGFDSDMTNVAGISNFNLYYFDYKVGTSDFIKFQNSNQISKIDIKTLETDIQKLINFTN